MIVPFAPPVASSPTPPSSPLPLQPQSRNSLHALHDSNMSTLGDKIQRLGMIRPFFLVALNQIVDNMLDQIDEQLNAESVGKSAGALLLALLCFP
jgi:hypothetical protein